MAINLNRVKYEPVANRYADQYGVPRAVLSSILTRESNWNPRAVGTTNDLGIAQFIPSTANDYGITDRLDPFQSIEGAAKYLRDSFREFGNWPDAIRSYNVGRGGSAAGNGFEYLKDVLQLMPARERSDLLQGRSLDEILRAGGVSPAVGTTGKEAQAAQREIAGLPPIEDDSWLGRLVKGFKSGVTFVGFGLLAILLIGTGAWRLSNE